MRTENDVILETVEITPKIIIKYEVSTQNIGFKGTFRTRPPKVELKFDATPVCCHGETKGFR